MVTLFVKKNIYKIPNAKYAVKVEISMKTKSFNDSAKRSAFSAGKRQWRRTICLLGPLRTEKHIPACRKGPRLCDCGAE